MRKFNYRIISLLFVMVCFVFCKGQSKIQSPNVFAAEHLELITLKKTSSALPPHNYVHCGLQDKTGNFWFGGSEGIFLYDGKSFTNYTDVADVEKFSLIKTPIEKLGYIYSILEDKNGNIWFGTTHGVCLYDGKKFSSLIISENAINSKKYDSTLFSKSVICIFEDKTGNIWFGTQNSGAYRYNGKTLTNFTASNGLSNNCVQSILQLENGELWFGTRGSGVSRYNNGIFSPLSSNEVPYNHLTCIRNDRTGNVWFGTVNAGARYFNGKTYTDFTIENGLCSNNVSSILISQNEEIYFGTNKGLSCYNGKSFSNFTVYDGLCNNDIKFLLEDKSGKLWIGTKKGICSFDGKSFAVF